MLKDDKGDPLKLSGYATQLGTSSFPHDPYSSPGEGEPSGPIIHLDSIQIATTHSDDPWAVGVGCRRRGQGLCSNGGFQSLRAAVGGRHLW